MNPVTGLLILAFLATEKAPAPCAGCPAEQTWELSLAEAVRVGIGNAEVAQIRCERMEEDGQVYVTIAPASRAASAPRFKAEVMARVRSVEQQYWDLVRHHVQSHAAEGACATARDVLQREQAELKAGRGTVADVAEAQQRLEQLNLDLVARTSEVIATERQLRNILGLPPADNRRIVPVTKPVEREVKHEWEACRAAMMSGQPDIVEQRTAVYAAGLHCLAARVPGLVSLLGQCPSDAVGSNDAQDAASAFRRQQAFLEQVVHQTTHCLARFFLETDSNYKQLETASRLRTAAAQRLKAQRTFYEERRIPIDRYLDAVSQYAAALAQQAQFTAAYNVSLAALEEAKGTLLDYRKVTIEETPAAPAQIASANPPRSLDPDVKPAGAQTDPAPAASGKHVTFDITIGEARPIRVRGTISIAPGR